MVARSINDGFPALLRGLEEDEEVEVQREAFVTEGTEELKEARTYIAHFSLRR